MKTVTDVNTVNQLLTYSKQAEAGIHQKAIQMLLGAGNNKKQDSLSISDAARGFYYLFNDLFLCSWTVWCKAF